MNCQEFWDTLPEPGASEGAAHLAECAECAARMDGQKHLASAMASLGTEWRREEAPGHLETAALAAFRSQTAFTRARAVRRAWTPLLAWAAAAAFLIALSLMLVKPQAQPAAHRPSRSGGLQQAVLHTAPLDDETSADGFIPLPNAQRVDSPDTMNVVRVELPRSAMLALGLPVAPDRVTELVEADVMLGPDGLARAVRFVE
ncbi:MAG TPA: hypothetical protein VN736_06570 [Candidatus Limnocylindrales bacterium]|nr:hypothetical protein [Candidatus Limnocylindrales bacterium]